MTLSRMSRHVVRLDETCMETAWFFGFVCTVVLWCLPCFGRLSSEIRRFTKTSNRPPICQTDPMRSRFSGQMPLETCLLAHWVQVTLPVSVKQAPESPEDLSRYACPNAVCSEPSPRTTPHSAILVFKCA